MTVRTSKPALNLREKLSELDKPSGIAGQDILKADTPQEVFNYIGAGRRNLIINGGFQVSQRGDYSSNTAMTQNGFSLDRWKHLVQVVTTQVRRDNGTVINGETMSSYRMEATSTGTGRFGIRQYIEANGTRCPIEGKEATLSVWMRSNNPNACLLVYQYTSGGYIGYAQYTGNGAWQKVTLTMTGRVTSYSANAVTLELNFGVHTSANGNVGVTSGDYIEIAQPQLEVGSVATPFEHRSYGEELALCQRYYQFVSGTADVMGKTGDVTDSSILTSITSIPIEMRATPSIQQYGDTAHTKQWANSTNSVVARLTNLGDYSGNITAFESSARNSRTIFTYLTMNGDWNTAPVYTICDAEL